jgi:hypothetical protein
VGYFVSFVLVTVRKHLFWGVGGNGVEQETLQINAADIFL